MSGSKTPTDEGKGYVARLGGLTKKQLQSLKDKMVEWEQWVDDTAKKFKVNPLTIWVNMGIDKLETCRTCGKQSTGVTLKTRQPQGQLMERVMVDFRHVSIKCVYYVH
jgi:hypothetical protein